MEDLMKLRESIDEIDSEIVRLYKERMDISKHVAEYKITTGKKVFDKIGFPYLTGTPNNERFSLFILSPSLGKISVVLAPVV